MNRQTRRFVDGIIDLSGSENMADKLYDECMKRTDSLGVDVVLDLQSEVSLYQV